MHHFVAFDDHDRLLLHFNPEQMFTRFRSDGTETVRLATMADLTDPVIQDAYLMFKRSGPFRLASFTVAGTEYLATVTSNSPEAAPRSTSCTPAAPPISRAR